MRLSPRSRMILATEEYLTEYTLVEFSKSSTGVYSFGDSPEQPAQNPKRNIWSELSGIKEEIDKLAPILQGREIIVTDQEIQGSYHEKWWNAWVTVMLPDGLEHGLSWDDPRLKRARSKSRVLTHRFVFQNTKQFFTEVNRLLSVDTQAHFTEEDYKALKSRVEGQKPSEMFLQNQVKKLPFKPNKRDWEGD